MSHKLALAALLTLILSACSTAPQPPAQPVTPKISPALKKPCDPLPKLAVDPKDTDIRPELLENRAASERVHAECSSRHRGVLRAIGVEPEVRSNARQEAIKAQRANRQPVKE